MTPQPTTIERPEQAEQTVGPERVRTAVVDAAARLFAERGIHAVSVREIAREVGVSHTLVHLYFGSKEEIVRQVLRRYNGEFATRVSDAEHLDRAVGETFGAVAREPALVRVLAAGLVEGIVPERIEAQPHAQRALVNRLSSLEDGTVDARVLAAAVSALTIGWAIGEDWLIDELGLGDVPRDKILDQVSGLLERMVRDYSA